MEKTSEALTVNYEGQPCYNIEYHKEYQGLRSVIQDLGCQNRKICIVTDSNVGRVYSDIVKKELSESSKEVYVFTFVAGEINKNLDTVKDLYEFLIHASFDRNDLLIALGGGVVGDLTGFAAATYLRGIRFIQAPTSLLSMVDSSIGGKTGVDFNAYKNMVGAFYMPKCVYMNINSLRSLNDTQYLSGMGEIIKHGLIKDVAYYHWMKERVQEIKQKDYNTILELIRTSCLIKKAVVENDPKEKGERALLNFGHTLGHAIEKLKGLTLLHGECVALGMVAASFISMRRGMISEKEFFDIENTIKDFSLPVRITGLSVDEILDAASRDKKMDGVKIKFILLKSVGEAYIDTTVTNDEMKAALVYVLGE